MNELFALAIGQKTFTPRQASRILLLDRFQISNWAKLNYLEGVKSAHLKDCKFSLIDLFYIGLLNEMSSRSIKISPVIEKLNKTGNILQNHIMKSDAMGEKWIWITDNDVFFASIEELTNQKGDLEFLVGFKSGLILRNIWKGIIKELDGRDAEGLHLFQLLMDSIGIQK